MNDFTRSACGLACCFLLAASCLGQSKDSAGVYQAPSPEPTAAETQILEYINRCRANPAQEGTSIRGNKRIPKTVDLDMFQLEMSQATPAPPLVFDLALLKAARRHSWYQIKHGQGHDEDPDLDRFTGASPSERARKAGFSGRGSAENVFLTARDPLHSHVGFVVDWGPGGTGGMQPNRGHRRNILSPRYRLAGTAAVDHGSQISVTHNFGGSSQRMAGGVVYRDINTDRFYDLDEGVGGIGLTVGENSVDSWASGAYAIPISNDQQKIKVKIGELTFVSLLPAGDDNVKFDVLVSETARYVQTSKLFQSVLKIPDTERNAERRFAALTDLSLVTQEGLIEESIFDQIIEATEPVSQQLDQAMAEVREAMPGEPAAAEELVAKFIKKYRRSKAKAWFAEAKICLGISKAYQLLKTAKDNGKKLSDYDIQRKVQSQQKVFSRLSIPEWRAFGLNIGKQMLELGQ